MNPVNLLVNAASPWILAHETLALLIACEFMGVVTLVATFRYCLYYGGVLYAAFMGIGTVAIGAVAANCGAWNNIVYGLYENDSLMLGVLGMSVFTPLVSMPEPYCMRSDWGVSKFQIVYYCIFLGAFITLLPCFVPITV